MEDDARTNFRILDHIQRKQRLWLVWLDIQLSSTSHYTLWLNPVVLVYVRFVPSTRSYFAPKQNFVQ